jgi:asparagine synthetase B (glutamine-hydrolysing)
VPKSRRAVATFALGDGDERFPAVHGFYTGVGDYPMGEFSFLDGAGDNVRVGRDRVGTRPLFYHGGSTVAAASDHRFLRGLGGGRLLEPGESVNLVEGSASTHPLPKVEPPHRGRRRQTHSPNS